VTERFKLLDYLGIFGGCPVDDLMGFEYGGSSTFE
jgi:hypothetical protein